MKPLIEQINEIRNNLSELSFQTLYGKSCSEWIKEKLARPENVLRENEGDGRPQYYGVVD